MHGDLDAKALALAEGWLGAAQGHPNFLAITVSTGISGAIVLDGDLLDGESGHAGEIGHVIVEPGGRRCRCGTQGCLDAEASGAAIDAITGRPATEPSFQIMQRTGDLVGRAAASMCNAFDLSLVVVGGSVALGFGSTFFHAAQVTLDDNARQPYSRGARITPSRLGEQGPLDRCRRGGLAGSATRRSCRSQHRISRRRLGRHVRPDRSRSAAATSPQRRSRSPRTRGRTASATSSPAGSIHPSQSTTRLNTRTWARYSVRVICPARRSGSVATGNRSASQSIVA